MKSYGDSYSTASTVQYPLDPYRDVRTKPADKPASRDSYRHGFKKSNACRFLGQDCFKIPHAIS